MWLSFFISSPTHVDMELENSVGDGDFVIPGDQLGPESRFSKGPGTTLRGGTIYSTLKGKVSIGKEGGGGDNVGDSKPVISVKHPRAHAARGIPTMGSLAVCRVINISERQARVNMMSVRGVALAEPFHGIIRKEDIRAMEKDTVEVFSSFRPRDIVRARVVALGEGQTYVLSTAENELGVVAATCDCGESMLPVSWCEVQCSKTGDREKRKVAKVLDAIPVQT